MKKFITVTLVLALGASVLAGCGGKKETEQTENTQAEETEDAKQPDEEASEEAGEEYGPEAYVEGIDTADYVTLGEYMGMEVSVADYVEEYIEFDLQNNPDATYITDRTVEKGDIVNIDYEGKIDGVAFDGGTAQGTDLEIGSGAFIPGFEDGLIGTESGATVDVEVTFPDNYPGTDVAGKDAVFTVTVNSIRVESPAELTDEFVKGLDIGCETVEEYRKYVYDTVVESSASGLMLQKVMENSQVKEAPEAMVTRYYDRIVGNMQYYAMVYGYDLDTFMSLNGTSDEECRKSAQQAGEEMLVMKAIADAEGLNVTPEELEAGIAEDAEAAGYEDAEAYKEAIDLKGYQEFMMSERVLNFLLENGVVEELE